VIHASIQFQRLDMVAGGCFRHHDRRAAHPYLAPASIAAMAQGALDRAFALALSLLLVTMTVFNDLGAPVRACRSPRTLSFIVWAAIRFEQRAVTAVIATISAIALWYTVHGTGQFARGSPDISSIFLLMYTSTLSVPALFSAP